MCVCARERERVKEIESVSVRLCVEERVFVSVCDIERCVCV